MVRCAFRMPDIDNMCYVQVPHGARALHQKGVGNPRFSSGESLSNQCRPRSPRLDRAPNCDLARDRRDCLIILEGIFTRI